MIESEKLQNKGPFLGTRHVQALLLFLCFVVNFIDRLKTSVAILAMTDGDSSNASFEEFDWDKTQKGYILSSFYWGMILTQFIGSFMCRKFGAKITILISTLGSALLTLITPVLIPLGGWQAYTIISIIQGMFQGLFTPCIHDHIAKWAPVEERIRLGAFAHSGIEMGTILAMGVPGFIAQSSWGWPGISYVSGGISVAWCILWVIFADNSPSNSRFISLEEKQFILTSQQKSDDEQKKIPIPWKAILTSVPFLSLIVIESAQALGFKTIQNEIPSYFHGILNLDIKSNSLFSALLYLVMFAMTNLCLFLSDYIMNKKIMSLTALRRTVSTISTWIPAVTLILVGFLDEQQKTLAIVLMTATVGVNGGEVIGSGLNAIDLSSNHAATLIGITTTAMSVIYMVTPLFVGLIVGDGTERTEWQIVFAITALVLFFANLQYIFLGKTSTQPWDDENFMLNKNKSEIGQENGEKQTAKEEPRESYINHGYSYSIQDT
ncbi:putative inorganic phosphate cotransporter [Episyrphus balteatus]|uniref:putative inorganic phosphate cotransporter n=1 Tax=Episyrphus balteatus TaxID=286459 RepID=UPI002485A406|nr:putative inorganic phosphate cotransporter [Episyrphus balteatus]